MESVADHFNPNGRELIRTWTADSSCYDDYEQLGAIQHGRKRPAKYLLLGLGLSILCVPVGGNEDSLANVTVELSKQKPLWLHVTVRSRAKTRATFYKYELPWGNYNSMEFVAVTPVEHFIERVWPVDDPSPERISMEPNETRSGDVNLQMKFIGLDAAVKKSSVRLFWAYNAPKELNISKWPGGLIFIPQQK